MTHPAENDVAALVLTDEPTVCIAHGAFIPCRRGGEHRYTSNPFWVKAVRDYQSSGMPDLTWEPAWEHPAARRGPSMRVYRDDRGDWIAQSSHKFTVTGYWQDAMEAAYGHLSMCQRCNPDSEALNPPSEGVTPDNPSKALTEAARPDSEGAGHGWWNYRVTKRGSDPEQGPDYEIREVYYRQDGSILGWTEKPCEPYGHSEAGLREDFQLMQEAFERPVLDLDAEEAKRATQ